ncbi:hypothetical protein V5O48_016888, partial [Marasmius crinis-equi]
MLRRSSDQNNNSVEPNSAGNWQERNDPPRRPPDTRAFQQPVFHIQNLSGTVNINYHYHSHHHVYDPPSSHAQPVFQTHTHVATQGQGHPNGGVNGQGHYGEEEPGRFEEVVESAPDQRTPPAE